MTEAERMAKIRAEIERRRELQRQLGQRGQKGLQPTVKARPPAMHWFRNR